MYKRKCIQNKEYTNESGSANVYNHLVMFGFIEQMFRLLQQVLNYDSVAVENKEIFSRNISIGHVGFNTITCFCLSLYENFSTFTLLPWKTWMYHRNYLYMWGFCIKSMADGLWFYKNLEYLLIIALDVHAFFYKKLRLGLSTERFLGFFVISSTQRFFNNSFLTSFLK